MKISLYLPKGTTGTTSFIKNELSTASNIKDRVTRLSVISNLNILSYSL